MQYFENNTILKVIPGWVKFLIQIGYEWPNNVEGHRRICMISMPCDSAAAGLVLLGALIRDLCNPDTNEVEGHYDSLLRFAHQYLLSCRHCELAECNPRIKRCGYTAKSNGRLRSVLFPRKIFTISDKTDFASRQIAWEYPHPPGHPDNVTQFPNSQYAINWHIEGESPKQVPADERALPDDIYQRIVDGAEIIPDNLRRSFSGLCFSGRVAGCGATRDICATIKFGDDTCQYSLPDLLALQGWSPSNTVTRTSFFNARTEKLIPNSATPALVVADGDQSFLKVVGLSDFQRSDIIGVFHRTIERDRLEAIGDKIAGLQQWYLEDLDMRDQITEIPPGIRVSILKKRT